MLFDINFFHWFFALGTIPLCCWMLKILIELFWIANVQMNVDIDTCKWFFFVWKGFFLPQCHQCQQWCQILHLISSWKKLVVFEVFSLRLGCGPIVPLGIQMLIRLYSQICKKKNRNTCSWRHKLAFILNNYSAVTAVKRYLIVRIPLIW